MKTISGASVLVAMTLIWAVPASAAVQMAMEPDQIMTQELPKQDGVLIVAGDDYPISASEAASIAQSTMPGAKVLKVKLLSNGVYDVTLKEGGNVTRVRVDATTGDIV